MRRLPALAALVLLLPAPSLAQDTERHAEALAAGYKASFLCSGMFNAGLGEAQIAADEFTLTYQEFRARLAAMPATVDRATRTVSVPFAPDMPPRVAAWRPGLGCTNLPIGAAPEAVGVLPALQARTPRRFDALPWPTGDAGAETRRPAPTVLHSRVAAAFDRKSYGEGSDTTGVVIVADGRIVAERYRSGYDKHTPQRTWSVAKSLAATVIGAAVQDGLLDVKAPAPIPEWRRPGDPRARITLENLLHMASGLYSEAAGNRTDMTYFGGTAVSENTVGLPLEAPPGRRWLYANNDTLLAVRALRAAIGDDRRYHAYPFREVFWKIGMARTTPETDWDGDFILSSQVWTTARDLARLGMLHLNDGVWEGERVLPPGWVRYVTTPAPAQPTGSGPGYGAQWWLYGPQHGLPQGTYAARGNRGQYIVVVPSRKVVIVRRGFDAVGPGGQQFDIAKFSADVLAALEGRS